MGLAGVDPVRRKRMPPRTMISGVDSLCAFLREFHREWNSDPGIPAADLPAPLPDPLARFYREVGKLDWITRPVETA